MSVTFVLRHGESTANVEGLIVSAPDRRALVEVGLTPRGREQARAAGDHARELGLGATTILVTSDFARARETAGIVAATLGAEPPRIDQRLRERAFGRLDGGPITGYTQVWEVDAAHGEAVDGVESVASVAARFEAARHDARRMAADRPVVLVAHGDVLQIGAVIAAGLDPHDHRRLLPLGNAELRMLPEREGGVKAWKQHGVRRRGVS